MLRSNRTIRRPLPWLCLALLVISLGLATQARATMVAPHALFMDHRSRAAVFYVHNPGQTPQEIEVELVFGYPQSDADGRVRVELQAEPAENEPSAAGWVKALPRRMSLEPGGRQAVRLLAKPPAGLPDGEYWSRIVITARERPPEIEDNGTIQVGLTLTTRTVISLNYRKGEVTTGVRLRSIEAALVGTTLNLELDLERTGNSAYLGSVDLVLVDRYEQERQVWHREIAVYRELLRRYALEIKEPLLPGEYRLDVRVSTDRRDLDPNDVLPAPEIIRHVPLVLEAKP